MSDTTLPPHLTTIPVSPWRDDARQAMQVIVLAVDELPAGETRDRAKASVKRLDDALRKAESAPLSGPSEEQERLATWCDDLAGECGFIATSAERVKALNYRTIASLLRSSPAPQPRNEELPKEPWIASQSPDDGTPPWCVGIRNKGPREWFDTEADAERAVAMLNRATFGVPDSEKKVSSEDQQGGSR